METNTNEFKVTAADLAPETQWVMEALGWRRAIVNLGYAHGTDSAHYIMAKRQYEEEFGTFEQ